MASVKVAVRVRPFNPREKEASAKRIIEMQRNTTKIFDKPNSFKQFAFDFSYWSFDEADNHFASQQKVFDDLGNDVVVSAFKGYNACIFAYGQTGSGKTYTMMGTKENQGLIPRICKALFSHRSQGSSYKVEVSYLEIYNERVKDLLKPESGNNLKIREHPTSGPVIQQLSKHIVTEYRNIQALLRKGNSLRKTASTKMNNTSSRSHAIFTVMFAQAGVFNDMPTETVSKIHLVDLAGSERADASEADGERLKEGAHINKSLVTLGSVISALAELPPVDTGSKKGFIPYRNSVLTWLLKDSLGGNSRTIMIAAISPADSNVSETMSTLRYANHAKKIINKPTVNEDPNVKLIRELRAEISKLKTCISTGYSICGKKHSLKEELLKKEEEEKFLTEKWEKKWEETQVILQEQEALALRKAGTGVVLDSDRPHLICIDDNLLSTGVALYHLLDGETLIGTREANLKQHIILNGSDMKNEHCVITLKNGEATIIPKENALCWVNGQCIDSPTTLYQGCIIMVGQTNMFRYNDPAQAEKMRKEGDISRSHLNLSRISMMTWSTPNLAQSLDGSMSSGITSPGYSNSKHIKKFEEQYQNERQRIEHLETLKKYYEELCQKTDCKIEIQKKIKMDKDRIDELIDKKIHLIQKQMNESIMKNIKHIEKLHISNEGDTKKRNFGNLDEAAGIINNYYIQESRNIEKKGTSHTLIPDCEGNVESNDDYEIVDQDEKEESWSPESVKPVIDRKLESLKLQLFRNQIALNAGDNCNTVQRQFNYELQTSVSSMDCLLDMDYEDRAPSQRRSVSLKDSENMENCNFNLHIPSFVLRGTGNRTHYEYEVIINVGIEEWSVLRRFSRFRQLHLQMKRKYGSQVSVLEFPPRKPFFRQSEVVARERRPQLELYLQKLFDTCSKIAECPLNSEVSKEKVIMFSNFFQRGVFETGKYATG